MTILTPSESIDSGDTPRTEAASHVGNGHAAVEEAQMPRPQCQRRPKSLTKVTKLAPHFSTPPRMLNPVSSSSHSGGPNGNHADNADAQAPTHSGNTLDSYVPPKCLRMNRWDINFLISGMEVIKVSKNGKQQTRRIAISPDNRAIYITSNRPQGRVLSLLKRTSSDLAHGGETSVPVKEIDLSMVVRMQLGQQSRRFERARSKSLKQSIMNPVTPKKQRSSLVQSESLQSNSSAPSGADVYSLSIIYRPPANNTTHSTLVSVGSNVKDNFVNAMMTATSPSNSLRVLDDGEDSLDLIIPSKADYDALSRTLEDLLALYKEVEPSASPLFAWIQYHLVDMGKRLGIDRNGVVVKGGVSCSDWINLCRRWNAPVNKTDATLLYDTYCESLGKTAQADGLEFLDIVRLLDILRQWIAKHAKEGIDIIDPRQELFDRVAKIKTDEKSRINSPSKETGVFVKGFGDEPDHVTTISATTFLHFLHTEQKETNWSLEDVKDLFGKLNGYQDFDVVSTVDGVTWEREYISLDCFARYILLETNDAFDPKRTAHSESSMTEPLNNYWINTSHDTYLRRTSASSSSQKQLDLTDLQSYTLALYRGARAIELDVWDGPNGTIEPVVRSGVSSFPDETAASDKRSTIGRSGPGLIFSEVLKTVMYFLQSEPNSYPIILLIENHCSPVYQKKMASDINAVLGKNGILYQPYVPDVRSLPSPAELIGKVIIKSKRTDGSSSVLNDDFDDENRAALPPSYTEYDSEDDLDEEVIGFKSTGTIKTADGRKLSSLKELFQTANTEALDSKSAANAAHSELMDAVVAEQQARRHADALLQDIGITYEELKAKREIGGNYVEEGTEVELCQDQAKVKESVDHALEIAKAFAESVEESRLLSNAANAEARSETELFEIARSDLLEREIILSDAKEALQDVIKHNADLEEAAERALAEARTNREYADNAQNRVQSVKALLSKTHNQAISSETVANTADTEAKISEQRANDAEARAKKARDSSEEDRKKADQETKLEDELESQLASAMANLNKARESVKAAREKADNAITKAEKVTDEISLIKSASKHQTFGQSASYDDEQPIVSLVDERKTYMSQMEDAFSVKLSREKKTRQLSASVEDLSRRLKLQAKTAAAARRQADHSLAIADQMEEHALEEREAANLRCVAREKAKLSLKRSDDVMHSTEEQLAEAERAASEASKLAVLSRKNAERLSQELKNRQNPSSLERAVKVAQEDRDAVYAVYESAKESKEKADQIAAEAKSAHDKDCIRLKTMEREAMAELLNAESAEQAEVLAINACENANALRDRLRSLEQKCKNAEDLADEKAGALEIATRYKDKKIRMQPLSQELSNMTFFHSCKYKSWEKSAALHVCSMHSIPDSKVVEHAEKGKAEWTQYVEFNKNHITRTYPQSSTRNYNPLLPWALGCQCVSLNFIRNQFMLLNDGRFRVNGNRGYVLKPEYLCKNSLDEAAVDDAMNCKHPRIIRVRVLSGYCIPKSEETSSSSSLALQKRSISPFVKVTMYDGSPATFLKPPTHSTAAIQGNGLNPIWNDKEISFACLNPSVGMLMFAVYDHCDMSKSDLFIGASAIPVSCLQEGYRSVSLYDSNNMRSGAMRFASLLIKVKVDS